jgi:hypothetical protein
MLVLYEWEEKPGEPLQTLHRTGVSSGARLLMSDPFIEIFLSQIRGKAVVLGHFESLRAATLSREPTLRCQIHIDGTTAEPK